MLKILTILISIAALTCHAQTKATPTIKGHTLGETVGQFVAESSPATHEQMKRCLATNDSDRYTVDGCEEFMSSIERSPTSDITLECHDPRFDMGVCRDFRGYAKFSGNKLVELNLEIIDKEWSEALSDVIEKFGKPDETHVDTMQNAYGAKFDLQKASWATSDYLVYASEKINLPYNLNRFVEVNITDTTYFQNQHPKAHSNALN